MGKLPNVASETLEKKSFLNFSALTRSPLLSAGVGGYLLYI